MNIHQLFLKRPLSLLLAAALLLGLSGLAPLRARAAGDFSDVPKTHWAYGYITELRERGVTDGVGNNKYGLGRTVTRAEFAAFLCKLMGWPLKDPANGHFTDVKPSDWFYPYVETAFANGCLAGEANFQPNEAIRRDDMAVMIVRSLGYDKQAAALSGLASPFSDVTGQIGYIHMASSFGIINGVGDGKFAPMRTAAREEAAAMLIRMVHMLDNEIDFMSAFYAIRSAPQMDVIDSMDAVCFGWARLELTNGSLSLNTTAQNSNEYNIPAGYGEPYNAAKGKQRLLFAAVRDADAKAILASTDLCNQAVALLTGALDGLSGKSDLVFDGIVMDFEGLKAAQKPWYTALLLALRIKLGNKLLYVTVHPARRPGVAYFDGYDFSAIGDLADKVILMAHDYEDKFYEDIFANVSTTALAPLNEVYIALAAITHPDTGVSDRSKVLLQLNFATAQWKFKFNDFPELVNQTPYTPVYDAVATRLRAGGQVKFDDTAMSPELRFTDTNDGTDNIVYYENRRSIDAKVTLAKRFGIGGLSLWRLGTIPDFEADIGLDVLDYLLGGR